MSKRSDDNVEKFFQKAVAQQDTSHVDHDWANMEKLLDANTPRPQGVLKIKRTLTLGAVVLLLLVPAALWWNYSRDDKNKTSGANSSERFVTKKESEDGSISILPETDGALADGQKKDELPDRNLSSSSDVNTLKDEKRPAEGAGPQVVPSQKVTAGSLSSLDPGRVSLPKANALTASQAKKKSVRSAQSTSESLLPGQTEEGEQNSTPQSNKRLSNVDAASGDRIINNTSADTAEGDDAALHSEIVVAGTSVLEQKRESDVSVIASPMANNSAVENPDSTHVVKKKSSALVTENEPEQPVKDEESSDERIQTPFSAIVSIAPDFSSTKIGRYEAPGAAFGFLVAFKPFKRWQIATGLYKSSKRYEGYGKEYQPPQGYWERRTNGVVPDEIFGQCSILEWPILLRYDVASFKKSSVFASAGVSSYRMTHERYQYTFLQENPGAATGWEASKSSEYRFSIGHVSAGYERQLSPALSVIVEPYVKIPFAGIGWSNINLHSTGIYFSVRYTLLRKQPVRSINLQTPVK